MTAGAARGWAGTVGASRGGLGGAVTAGLDASGLSRIGTRRGGRRPVSLTRRNEYPSRKPYDLVQEHLRKGAVRAALSANGRVARVIDCPGGRPGWMLVLRLFRFAAPQIRKTRRSVCVGFGCLVLRARRQTAAARSPGGKRRSQGALTPRQNQPRI